MAYETERERIAQIVERHSSATMVPDFSAGPARHIVKRCKTLGIKVPLVVQRYMDRLDGAQGGVHEKLARDLHGKSYAELAQHQREQVDSIRSAVGNYNPATGHPYEKPGFTFGQGHRLLLDTYRAEVNNNYPQDLRAALIDFRRGLEQDLDSSAKHGGFFKEYSEANRTL